MAILWTVAHQTPQTPPWNSTGKNTGVGSHSLLQGIFLTQESNPGLLHCRQILYHLKLPGKPLNLSIATKNHHHHHNPQNFKISIPVILWDIKTFRLVFLNFDCTTEFIRSYKIPFEPSESLTNDQKISGIRAQASADLQRWPGDSRIQSD